MSQPPKKTFDVAIIGGGPAGLSAAITLGRACRRVVVFDHGRPRNQAARHIHCFLGHDGIAPADLRARGRVEAERYGAVFIEAEVLKAACISDEPGKAFRVHTEDREIESRIVLLTTGVVDELPEIDGLRELYGQSVHHCPYCDGWEHRGRRLVALGQTRSAVELAVSLRGWSEQVTLCSHGADVSAKDERFLQRHGIAVRTEPLSRLVGSDGALQCIEFAEGADLACDAVFFSSGQGQRSSLPAMLGCDCDDEGLIVTGKKNCTSVEGVYLAGDADGDSQFAITAAAEGATAATAIDRELKQQDFV